MTDDKYRNDETLAEPPPSGPTGYTDHFVKWCMGHLVEFGVLIVFCTLAPAWYLHIEAMGTTAVVFLFCGGFITLYTHIEHKPPKPKNIVGGMCIAFLGSLLAAGAYFRSTLFQ